MHTRIVIIALMLPGCGTAPIYLDAYQGCQLAPNVWRQVNAPLHRELLLDLPEEFSKKPVRELFVATNLQREVWFEDSGGNLQACIYNPEHACYTAEVHKVIFKKFEASWQVGQTMQLQCFDDIAVDNKPHKERGGKSHAL